jgi:hypothetical protein
MMLKWLFSAVVIYGGFVALLYVAPRMKVTLRRVTGAPKSSWAKCSRER